MLADYRTGILRGRDLRLVESHLAECPACARELRVLDEVLALVSDSTAESEPPAGLWNGVANRIAAPERSYRPAFAWRPLRIAGVGAATIALAVGIWLGGMRQEPVTPIRIASSNEYVQGHALYAGQAPLADRVSYLSLVASGEPQHK